MFMDAILVSLNPHKPLANLYDLAEAHRYSGKRMIKSSTYFFDIELVDDKWLVGQRFDMSPAHVFTVAENAYHCMRQFNTDQVVVFRGLSGSGKTQNTNLVLHCKIDFETLGSFPISPFI
jgi:myosin heavy subunit